MLLACDGTDLLAEHNAGKRERCGYPLVHDGDDGSTVEGGMGQQNTGVSTTDASLSELDRL